MKAKEAYQLGEEIAALVQAGQLDAGYTRLSPVLAVCTPFPMLERIGEPNHSVCLIYVKKARIPRRLRRGSSFTAAYAEIAAML